MTVSDSKGAVGGRHVSFLVPGSLDARTGGYEYDRRIVAALRERGWIVDVRELDASFPYPLPAALLEAGRELAMVSDGGVVLIDGLAFGAMPDQVQREAGRLRLVALIHMPLDADVGLDATAAARLGAAERFALRFAALIVSTGTTTVRWIEAQKVPCPVVLVEPGTDRAAPARGSGSVDTVQLLSVGTINPGKGHEMLIEALSTIPERNWRLTCAGSLSRSPDTAERVRRLLDKRQLADRVTMTGELSQEALSACYDSADVFVLATLRETYGMAVAEAIARGLPVISTATGEIPNIVGDGGIIVPPGDADALTAALSSVLDDSALRDRLRESAKLAGERLRTWDQAGDDMADALERVAANV